MTYSSAITQHKFSDIEPGKKLFELHVGACVEPPSHFNVYDETRSDFFSLVILLNGNVDLKLNFKEQSISKNSLIFLIPNTLKQLVNASEDVSLYKVIFTSKFLLQIGIDKKEIEMIEFHTRSGEASLALSDKEIATLKKIIEDLKEKNDGIHEHPFGEDLVKYTFRILLSEMAGIVLKHNVTTSIHKMSRKQDLVMQFGNLVNNHFRENRSVKFYADQLAITPKYLTEIVHEVTGESASAIIDEKVMYEAKVLLNNPRLSIAQIADALHFSDQSFLGKFFKRHLGLSPSQYRNHKFI